MTTKKGIFLFLLFLLPFLFASKLPKRPYFLPPKSEHSYSRSLSLSPLLSSSSSSYFDPHNHYSGILPWDAYPNITSYINNDPLSFNQSLNLWYFLNQTFYPTANPLPTFTPTSRIGSGSWATLFLFQNVSEFQENPEILYGVLERLLTTTPYTEFDTAYNFRSAVLGFFFSFLFFFFFFSLLFISFLFFLFLFLDPEDSRSYYLSTLFPDDPDTINSDICTATVSTLTNTGISSSEQSLPFTSHKWTEEKQVFSFSFFILLISYFLFLISYFLFLISHFSFLISHFSFLISHFFSHFSFLISTFPPPKKKKQQQPSAPSPALHQSPTTHTKSSSWV